MNPVPPSADPEATELLATRLSGHMPADGQTFAPGARLGRYRLEGLLGRGGMGEVYRAEQLEPVRRTVALKLLRGHRVEARHLAYFEIERQLLAQMRHPAIAQIYDAGATDDGVPFFAMEFSEGRPVTVFCAEEGLDLRERLALFIRICEGVQHAHHKGVIHRDLKPGNILVDRIDGRAAPKIIDFGIATATSRALAVMQERAGTPDYMSPEQAEGDLATLDTRSDVYSLGVLLHELLTGSRPGVRDGGTADGGVLRLPSEQLAAQSTAATPAGDTHRLRRALREELDWVVAKAMAHDRNARYASVAELAAELQRFLEGAPLAAVPPTRRYRWSRFFARHRTALVAAAVVGLALLGGLAVSVYGLMQARAQRTIAEQRSAELEKVAAFQQSMLEGIDIEAMGGGLAGGMRDQIAAADPSVRASLEQLLAGINTADLARGMIDRDLLASAEAAIDRDFARQPALAANLRESVARVYAALGMSPQAAREFGKVADYRAGQSGEADRTTLAARLEQAEALLGAAEVDAAAAIIERAQPLARPLPLNDPTRAGLEIAQASLLSARGERERAKTLLQSLHERLAKQAGDRDPAAMDALNALADMQRAVGEMAEARANMEKLLPLRVAVQGAEHKDTLAATGNLAVMRMITGEKEGAVKLQRELLAIQTRRLGNDHPLTLHARGTLASMLADSNAAEEALPMMKAVLAGRERVLGPLHPQTIRARLNLATTYARLDDYAAALPLERQVLEQRTRVLGANHPDTLSILINHAGTLLRDGHPQQSLALLRDGLPLARDVLGMKHPQAQRALLIRGDAARTLGDAPLALASYREVVEVRSRLLGEQHPETLHAIWTLATAEAGFGHREQAQALRRQYLEPLLAASPDTLSEPLAALADAIREGRPPTGFK